MREVHLQLAVLEQRKSRELRPVVTGDGFEHLISLLSKVGHFLLQGIVDRLGSMIVSLDPNAHPRHAFHQGQNARLVFVLFADDRVELPMTNPVRKFTISGVLRWSDRVFSYFRGLFGFCVAA